MKPNNMNPSHNASKGFVPKGPSDQLSRWCANCGQHIDLHGATSIMWSLRTCPKSANLSPLAHRGYGRASPEASPVGGATTDRSVASPPRVEVPEEPSMDLTALSPRALRRAVEGRSYTNVMEGGIVSRKAPPPPHIHGDRAATGDEYNHHKGSYYTSPVSPRAAKLGVHKGYATRSDMTGGACLLE